MLVIAPFFTSFLVRTLAWGSILSDNGPVVDTLRAIGLLGEQGRLLATPVAVVAGLTYNFLPFMTLPLYASLERLDSRLLEAANDPYASAWTTFRTVTLPLSMPGVVAGTLLTFIPAAGDFVERGAARDAAAIHGRQRHRQLVPRPAGLPGGRGAVVHAHGEHRGARRGLRAPRGHGQAGVRMLISPMRWLANRIVVLVAAAVLVYLFLPVAVVLLLSFNKPAGRGNYTFQEFTVENWANPCGAGVCGPLLTSVRIAFLATVLATVLGTLAAFAWPATPSVVALSPTCSSSCRWPRPRS